MIDIPDKIKIDDVGRIEPEASAEEKKMIIDINGKRETVSFDQAIALAINILYQIRLYDEHNRS